jgi:hypothetical protein
MSDLPKRSPSGTEPALPLLFGLVIVLLIAAAFVASIYGRGLFNDGAYYLYRVAERENFYLVDPARTTVQVLRQAPVVLLSKIGGFSLMTRGQLLSFAMLALPALLVALCWFIAPADRKAWTLLPLLSLLTGFCTTTLEAVGEGSIAVSYFWILLFLFVFRTRDAPSQILFLLLCIPAFQTHEGAFPLMLVMLLAAALRVWEKQTWTTAVFLGVSAVIFLAILVYQIEWVIHPRQRV